MERKKEIEELMKMEIPWKDVPDGLEVSDELIELEIPKVIDRFDNFKMKQHKPSGEAFHEKKEKNKKVNKKVRHETLMQKKYKKQYRKKKKK
jgi:ATP-dependent RNA helicase RhlE